MWKCNFQVKDLLSEENSDDACRRVAKEISRRIRNEPEKFFGYAETLAEVFDQATNLAEVNSALDTLYDFADEYRIWIE